MNSNLFNFVKHRAASGFLLVCLVVMSDAAFAYVSQTTHEETGFADYVIPTNEIPGNRHFLYKISDNFNGTLVLLLHGATGTPEGLLDDLYTKEFIDILTSTGYGVVLPAARPDFGEPPFYRRWESENVSNPDIDYLRHIMINIKNSYNQAVPEEKKIKSEIIMGGSSGAVMASRMALTEDYICGLVVFNGGNADQLYLDASGTISYNDNFIIPGSHPPTINVVSAFDNIIDLNKKIDFSTKLQAAGVPNRLLQSVGGTHNWGDWVREFYPTIMGDLAWVRTQPHCWLN